MNFRTLKANEINVRVQSCNYNPKTEKCCAIYLLYKDARCDMNILDESVGCANWQRTHEVIDGKLYCNVMINVAQEFEAPLWVLKQDVGVESNTEAEKGQASDSFKRACFNWGIGRELYTSPLIKIWLNKDEDYYVKNDKAIPTLSLDVATINYDEKRNIVRLVLTDQNGKVRFDYNKEVEDNKKTIPQEKKEESTKEDVEKHYHEIRSELAKNGLLLSDEKIANWIKKNAKVDDVDCELLTKAQIKEVNKAMIFLLQQKKVGAK